MPSPKQNVLQCSVLRRMRCLFAVVYQNLCKPELCKHLGHGNKAFSSRRRCRTRFGGYGVSCAAHVGTIAGERAGARSASYEIGLSFCLSGKKIAPCSNIGTRGYPAVCRGFALHADSDRWEGTCVCKIPHHCVPSPEPQNPVCFRTIQYIGLTSIDSAEPVF